MPDGPARPAARRAVLTRRRHIDLLRVAGGLCPR
ncbi:putative leader peptide [Streptomyces sp. NPDC050085]